jgi:hypothetical protein
MGEKCQEVIQKAELLGLAGTRPGGTVNLPLQDRFFPGQHKKHYRRILREGWNKGFLILQAPMKPYAIRGERGRNQMLKFQLVPGRWIAPLILLTFPEGLISCRW